MRKIVIFLFLASFFMCQPAIAGDRVAKRQQRFLDKEVARVQSIPFRIFWIETKDGSSYIASSNGRFVISSPELRDVQTGTIINSIEELKLALKPNVDEIAMLYLVKKGRPSALVIVDEYCPYCERLVKDILSLLKAGNTPKYDIAVTFFPVHRQAVEATCKLMEVGPEKARELYVNWVKTQDPSTWGNIKCSPETRKKFLMMAAKLQMNGLTATPTVILPDGTQIVGYRNPEEFLFQEAEHGQKG